MPDSTPIHSDSNFDVVVHTSSPREASGNKEYTYPKVKFGESATLSEAEAYFNYAQDWDAENVTNGKTIPSLMSTLQEGINRVIGLALDPNRVTVSTGYGDYKRRLEPVVKRGFLAVSSGDKDGAAAAQKEIEALKNESPELYAEYVRRTTEKS